MIRARDDRTQEFAGIEDAIRLGQQILARRRIEVIAANRQTMQPDVAGRFKQLVEGIVAGNDGEAPERSRRGFGEPICKEWLRQSWLCGW